MEILINFGAKEDIQNNKKNIPWNIDEVINQDSL